MNILENIHGHQDLVRLTAQDRILLCQQIREFLISHVSKTGGHVSSNLGVVELTVAIETVYNTSIDRLVFDVGHQSYVHKILTDRQAGFNSLRQFGGMAGFPKPSESDADAFVAGHASSSVSIALGMARARTLQRQDYHVVALLGDGAATGGMVYEGLNDAAVSQEPMVIILNDNTLSIDHNVGGFAYHLRKLRTKERYLGMKQHYKDALIRTAGGKVVYKIISRLKDKFRRMLIPSTIFENMGLTYLGPVDGHDTEHLIALLRIARDMKRPVVIHAMTQKGRGYVPAQEHPKLFHGIGKFDPVSGEPFSKATRSFSDAFGTAMLDLAQEDNRVCAITAAMPGGTGLLEFKKQYPQRIFDVGIAESHAVSMAGGLAKQGMVPVVAIYSTFLQRAYDMVLQDICMLKLHVIFAVDRAGLVGEDGETHHGIFDIGFLRQAPNMTVLAPVSLDELQDMLRWAVMEQHGPVAIRYPRGGNQGSYSSAWATGSSMLTDGVITCHRCGDDVTLVTYGTLVNNVLKAAELLEQRGIQATVLRLLSLSPLPVNQILQKMSKKQQIIVVEESCGRSGVREALAWDMQHLRRDINVDGIDLGHGFVTHGAVDTLYKHYGLSPEAIADFVQEAYHEN